MTLDKLRQILKYKTVQEMLDLIELQHKNVSRIKADNPIRYKMIVNDIILKHHDINTDRLLDMIDINNKIKGIKS